jgi:anaerobic magnesium-protoporphyrin IX monomethyl ester cyclase
VKVLLIQPPIEDFYNTGIRTYPLPLLYLATKVRDICDVSVIDFKTKRKPRALPENPFPELNAYYKADTYTPLSLFTRYYRFGDSSDAIKQTIRDKEPDVVAISALFTAYYAEALEIARVVKEVSNGIITVIGGTHATIFPEHTLDSGHVDYAIRGEGETPFFQLISSLQTGRREALEEIPGLCFRSRDGSTHVSGIQFERDINLVPDRTFLNSADYLINRNPYTFFLTSRGCPFHCSFCGKPPVPYRKRNLAGIERELEDCLGLNIRSIDFEDDMLTFDAGLFNQVLDLLKGKDLTLSAMNGIYAESLTESTLERMSAAGFSRLNFSLVDINSSVAKGQKRHLPDRFLQLLPYLESSSFLTETHFIIGLPEQKPEDVMETLIFLMGKRLLAGPSVFYLAPGSPLFNRAGANGQDQSQYMRHMRSSYMIEANPLIPRNGIYTFMKLTRFINFVKSCLDREPSLKKLSDLAEFLKGRKEEIDKEILRMLLIEKRLMRYDTGRRVFVDEPQDKDLLERFFRMATGAKIKGFKTGNSLLVDV